MTPEELLEQQRRLGIAMTASDRAARTAPEPSGADGMPVADPSVRAAAAPIANARPFAMPDVTTLRTRATPETATSQPANNAQPQGFGFAGVEATPDQQEAYLRRLYAGDATGTAAEVARQRTTLPAGMMLNPAAYNYGRLSAPRDDLPAFVPLAQQRASRVGVIDLTTPISGSSPRSGEGRGTMLPVGNIQARDAILRAEFPRASRSELSALGNLSYNRPGVFNAAMAGTRLDPALVAQRARAADIQAASSEQSMRFAAEQQPYELARQRANLDAAEQNRLITSENFLRNRASDAAVQTYFSEADDAAIGAAARGGAAPETLFNMARLAADRAQAEREATVGAGTIDEALRGVPQGAPVQVSQNRSGRYLTQFQMRPPAAPRYDNDIERLYAARARAEAAGNAAMVRDIDARLKLVTTRPESVGATALREADAEKGRSNQGQASQEKRVRVKLSDLQ